MGHPEGFPGDAFVELALQGLARGEGDGVHQAVQAIPVLAQGGEKGVDLGVVGHVAGVDGGVAELGGQLGHAVPDALALVGEGHLGPFADDRLRDAIGDRAVGEHPGDQDSLTLQEPHFRRPFPVELRQFSTANGVEVYPIPAPVPDLSSRRSASHDAREPSRPPRRGRLRRRAGRRSRSGQGLPLRVQRGRDRLRPGRNLRPVLVQPHRQHLRHAAHLRLPGPAHQARAQHARGDAGDHRGRHALHDEGEAGHLLRRRRRVQGRQARARGRGLRVLDEAPVRPEEEVAQPLPVRRPDRGHGRGARARAEGEPHGLRRARRRPARARPLHLAGAPQAAQLQLPLLPRLLQPHLRRGARGGRVLRRAHCRAPRGHRALPAGVVEALLEDGLRGQSRLSRGGLQRGAGRGRPGRAGHRREARAASACR